MSYYKPPLGAGGGFVSVSGVFQVSGIYPASGVYQLSGIYPTSGMFQLSGAAGAGSSGSSFVGGVAIFSGNGSGTTYLITHSIGTTPTKFTAIPNSLDAMGDYRVEASGNTLSVIYTTARPSGASNIALGWMADTNNLSGNASLGSNILVGGTALFSGNTSGTTFLINHNIGVVPSRYGVVPSTVDAVGDYRVEASGNTLSVIYTAARASGASNIGLVWFADTNNVSGGPADPLNVGALNVSGTATFSGNLNAQSGIFKNLAIQGSFVFHSGMSGISFSGMQLLPSVDIADYLVFTSGSAVMAQRTMDGIIQFSGSGAPSSIINSCFGALVSGGTVLIKTGTYKPEAMITMSGFGKTLAAEQGAIILPQGIGNGGFSGTFIKLDGNDCAIRNLFINCSGSANGEITAMRIGQTSQTLRAKILNNTIFNPGVHGIFCDVNSASWLEGNHVQSIGNPTGNGILVSNCSDTFVMHNDAGGFGQSAGISLSAAGASRVIGNQVYTNLLGIALFAGVNNIVEGNFVNNNIQHGIRLYNDNSQTSGIWNITIRGNISTQNSDSAANSGKFDGIALICSSSGIVKDVIVEGNICNDTRFGTSGRQRYGISISGAGYLETLIHGNNVVGNVLAGINTQASVGSGVTIIGNLGYVTENKGSFLGSGNASTTVYSFAHGLAATPSYVDVNAASPQARATFDISGGTSNITVTYPVAPASGDVRLMWSAQV